MCVREFFRTAACHSKIRANSVYWNLLNLEDHFYLRLRD